jgi:very-short-patch-repair endonuclease
MVGRARELRKSMTVSEVRVWGWLRNRTRAGLKFRRQQPIGPYVVDFYCAQLNLAIEVDGDHHNQPGMIESDFKRTAYLHARGIEVVRIPNRTVAVDPMTAADIIDWAIEQRRKT